MILLINMLIITRNETKIHIFNIKDAFKRIFLQQI